MPGWGCRSRAVSGPGWRQPGAPTVGALGAGKIRAAADANGGERNSGDRWPPARLVAPLGERTTDEDHRVTQDQVRSMPPLSVVFAGASTGKWSIERLETVAGSPLAPASRLEVIEGPGAARPAGDAVWVLRGVTSNERYATSGEHRQLAARQEPLGRAESTRAALIPVRKSEAWWDLAQDERRRIFEESSHHIATGLEYLPAVARRLHHGRDLGEPFDFLTWFEFAPEHAAAFEELVRRLRETEEWTYVEREIDLRLAR